MGAAEYLDIATGAAGTLLAGGITATGAAAGSRIAHLFRRGTADEQSTVVALIGDPVASYEQRIERLAAQIYAHLVTHPDALVEFATLATAGSSTYNQQNTGSGTFIGRDHVGDLTINHHGTSR